MMTSLSPRRAGLLQGPNQQERMEVAQQAAQAAKAGCLA